SHNAAADPTRAGRRRRAGARLRWPRSRASPRGGHRCRVTGQRRYCRPQSWFTTYPAPDLVAPGPRGKDPEEKEGPCPVVAPTPGPTMRWVSDGGEPMAARVQPLPTRARSSRPPARSESPSSMTDLSTLSDAVLVVAIGRWTEAALAEVYRRHGGAVHALAQ